MALSYTAAKINIANSRVAITRPYTAGESVSMGQLVALKDADGYVWLADADDTELARAIGIVVEVAELTGDDVTAEAGDPVTVCLYGPVGGFSSLGEGTYGYVSATAGAIDSTSPADANTYGYVVGWCDTSTIFFVDTGVSIPAYGS
jgi:hypothetical protein